MREERQEPGLSLVTAPRVMTWSRDSSVTLTWFHEWAGGVLLGNPLLPTGERRGGKRTRDAQLATLLLLRPRDWGNRSSIEVLVNKNKTKQKIIHPALLRGREWCGHHLLMSSLLHLWVSHLRASCTCTCCQVWRGLDGLGVRPAPRRCLEEGCCGCMGVRAATGGRPWRQAGVEAAGFLWCMMCLIASVCFCAAENCWAKLLRASPRRPVCDTGAFRNCTFSCSFMSARHSQRWHSWTTSVDRRSTQFM